MKIFQNKRIYIAPKTPISIAFKEYLSNTIGFEFLGFIDKVKEDSDVSRIDNVSHEEFDYIIIISPNHDKAIYQEHQKVIKQNKIKIVTIQNNCYNILKEIVISSNSRIEEYSKYIDNSNQKREGIALISKGFVDSNNKYLFLYLLKHNIKSYILTDNQEQILQLKEFNLPYYELGSKEGDEAIAKAEYLVFDQSNYTYFYMNPFQKTIQLWHGVGLKKMAKLTNIEYDYFISTSNWTNETNFINVFCAKKFLNYGYPRNDIFFKNEEEVDLIFCNKEIYSLLKNKEYKKVALYMPTIREYLFKESNNLEKFDMVPLDFVKLNEDLIEKNVLLIVKFHPHVMEFFKDLIINEQFSNIIFYTTQGDIYPIIKYVDLLITDYSSIAYDFLLLDRPIIFFDYDRELYEKNMGGFLFDYDEYSPGIKVSNQIELTKAISLEDNYQEERKKIRDIFFDEKQQTASKNIIDKIFDNK